jgi:hypothetical protein
MTRRHLNYYMKLTGLQILSFMLVETFLLKLLLLKSLEMVIIGLEFFEIILNSQDLVTNAKHSLLALDQVLRILGHV